VLTLVDVVSGAGLGGLTIVGSGLIGNPSSSSTGALTVGANDSGSRDATVSGAGVVTRTTQIRVPAADARVTLIPSSFDLGSFDQLCRQPAIHRWQNAPAVVVETRELKFTSFSDASLPATGIVADDTSARQVALDMQSVISDLTGGHLTSLASISLQHSGAGATVPIMPSGQVTVARVQGMYAATGYGGYTRWEIGSSGNVQSASILLDTQFDNPTSAVASVLRMHEFGHALGLTHVTNRPSLMNPSAMGGPTDFDRQAMVVAWQRPIGNQSPDNDPSGATINRRGPSYWVSEDGMR
jgi:hypothetical protein